MSYLVFVNGLGPNYKGDNLYEFIFSNVTDEVWGEYWESKPANGYPLPPELKFIKKVGVLRNTDIKLELLQNSDFFSMMDAMDDVLALAWESDDFDRKKRIVFRFGESESDVKDKLYERDLVLEFEKKEIYEI
jgi:hypothetical protein